MDRRRQGGGPASMNNQASGGINFSAQNRAAYADSSTSESPDKRRRQGKDGGSGDQFEY